MRSGGNGLVVQPYPTTCHREVAAPQPRLAEYRLTAVDGVITDLCFRHLVVYLEAMPASDREIRVLRLR